MKTRSTTPHGTRENPTHVALTAEERTICKRTKEQTKCSRPVRCRRCPMITLGIY
ncbi:MAG: hypothetical protein KY476_21760 [Planctomycetes bacterium]|nr:hypothetical protein [Planctomycetota bacterium]